MNYEEAKHAGDYSPNNSRDVQLKEEIVKGLIKLNINLDNKHMSEIVGIPVDRIKQIESSLQKKLTIDQMEKPLTWDYCFAFDVGNPEEFRQPTSKENKMREQTGGGPEDPVVTQEWKDGIKQTKYYGQIFQDIWQRLEKARLSVKPFRSSDDKHMFLLVGITEDNLKQWADDRDTDLLLDPTNGCRQARKRGFPLALKTKLSPDEPDTEYPLPLSNWASMYIQYNHRAPNEIYSHYPRIYGQDEPQTIFDERTRLRIIYESIIADQGEGGAEIEIDTLIHDSKHPLKAVFALHNEAQLEEFKQDWVTNWNFKNLLWCPLDKIRNYFGEPVGYYFAFLQFYMNWLLLPSAVGLIFFIAQLSLGKLDITAIGLCAIFVIFWSVAFVDYWGREEARLRIKWGMTKYQQKAVARPQFHGEWTRDDVTGEWTETYNFFSKALKSGSSLASIILFLGSCIVAVVEVLILKDDTNSTIGKIGVGVLNGVMISVFDFLYAHGSHWLNDWENHRTEEDYQNAMILKSFFFKFFNSFASLFFLAFVRPYVKGKNFYCTTYPGIVCIEENVREKILEEIELQLITLFATAIVIQNVLETGVPLASYKFKQYQYQQAVAQQNAAQNEAGQNNAPTDGAAAAPPAEVQQILIERSQPENEMEKERYANTIDDMSELIIQYGYVTLFVIALPITPLLALINNIFEMKVDAFGMVYTSQRPDPYGSYGLGAWNSVLQFFSVIAVGTNIALITFTTKLVPSITPSSTNTTNASLIFFVIVSIVLALIVAFEKAIIPDVPEEVERAIERQGLIESILVLGARVAEDSSDPPTKDEDFFSFNPAAPFVDVSDLPDMPLGKIATQV